MNEKIVCEHCGHSHEIPAELAPAPVALTCSGCGRLIGVSPAIEATAVAPVLLETGGTLSYEANVKPKPTIYRSAAMVLTILAGGSTCAIVAYFLYLLNEMFTFAGPGVAPGGGVNPGLKLALLSIGIILLMGMAQIWGGIKIGKGKGLGAGMGLACSVTLCVMVLFMLHMIVQAMAMESRIGGSVPTEVLMVAWITGLYVVVLGLEIFFTTRMAMEYFGWRAGRAKEVEGASGAELPVKGKWARRVVITGAVVLAVMSVVVAGLSIWFLQTVLKMQDLQMNARMLGGGPFGAPVPAATPGPSIWMNPLVWEILLVTGGFVGVYAWAAGCASRGGRAAVVVIMAAAGLQLLSQTSNVVLDWRLTSHFKEQGGRGGMVDSEEEESEVGMPQDEMGMLEARLKSMEKVGNRMAYGRYVPLIAVLAAGIVLLTKWRMGDWRDKNRLSPITTGNRIASTVMGTAVGMICLLTGIAMLASAVLGSDGPMNIFSIGRASEGSVAGDRMRFFMALGYVAAGALCLIAAARVTQKRRYAVALLVLGGAYFFLASWDTWGTVAAIGEQYESAIRGNFMPMLSVIVTSLFRLQLFVAFCLLGVLLILVIASVLVLLEKKKPVVAPVA